MDQLPPKRSFEPARLLLPGSQADGVFARQPTEYNRRMAYSRRFDDALAFAAELHRDQVRKATNVPYITHLLAVAALVGEHADDEDAAIAALLHDAVEDQGGAATRRLIADRFGERVASLVDACTDADVVPKPPWKPRKEAYIAHLRDPKTPPEACLISAADKLHNARCIVADLRSGGMSTLARFNASPSDVRWYYNSVSDALNERLPNHPLADELRRTVETLARLITDGETSAAGGSRPFDGEDGR
jgi:(p)ppGpp synthase/HD superfamily hydrolase